MKSTAFIIMPFNESYNELYIKVLKPSLTKLGFKVIRADEIEKSTFVAEDIEKAIKSADLVIVEATEKNQNVYFEFGIAISLKKEIIILTTNTSDLPFDTKHIRHLKYDNQDLESVNNVFVKWVKNSKAYEFLSNKKSTIKLNRGETFVNIFDSTSNIVTSNLSTSEQIKNQIKRGSLISCFHSYNTDKGALHWLNLCSDPLYKVYRESIDFLSKNGGKILDLLGESFINSNPDFISLGPGNGQKDRVLLKALMKKTNGEMYYYPVDISLRILSSAIKCLQADKEIEEKLKIKAIHSQFDNLSDFRPVFDYRPEPNLFAFLGNTLGNIQNEITLLHSLKSAMNKGDILFLEVRRKINSPELGGDEIDQIGLSFSPLAQLGIPYDSKKIYKREEDSFSQIDNTQTIVTHCKDIIIDKKKYDDVILSCVNYYDKQSLESTLCGKSLNFELLKSYQTELLIYFVLRKT